jgi:C_GCAxxG_C_C family probable redox protein
MPSRVDAAVALFDEGYNCAQSVFAAFAPSFGVDRDMALRLTNTLGAGMNLSDGPCGALNGALHVLGLRHGGTAPDDEAADERLRELSRDLIRRFRERCPSASCTKLLGIDISTPEGFARAKAADMFAGTCPDSVRAASEILLEML